MYGTVKKDKREPEAKRPFGYQQWSESPNGSFSPAGSTVAAIAPGYYDLAQSQSGQIFFLPIRARGDELIRFPDSASVAVLNGIVDFWEREDLFAQYDLPFKRGILLYGPPGSGKSCTLQLACRDVVERGGIVLTFPQSSALFLAAYRALRDIQPDIPVVVLMEDFEVTIKKVDESALLNLLDGVEELHKVVFLATTNYPEKLDPRVINRPSRFDVRVRVDPPSEQARRIYLANLVQEGDHLDIDSYVADTAGLSLAHVKELFVATHILGSDYRETVTRLQTMRERVTSLDEPDDAGLAAGGVVSRPGHYL